MQKIVSYMQKETYHENQQNEIFKIRDSKICFKKGPTLVCMVHIQYKYNKTSTVKIFYQVIKSQLQLEGQSRIPKVSCDPIKIPIGTSRGEEVRFLSMFYKNNLLNGFLFTIEREKCPSPLCKCLLEDQTAFHVLTSCTKVDLGIREEIILMLLLGNDVATADLLVADNISLLNCSRDEMFVQKCLQALKTSLLKLCSKLTLLKKGHISGQPKP